MTNSQKSDALSAQQIVDCMSDGKQTCSGGTIKAALDYVKEKGLTCDSAYSYVGKVEKLSK